MKKIKPCKDQVNYILGRRNKWQGSEEERIWCILRTEKQVHLFIVLHKRSVMAVYGQKSDHVWFYRPG